MKIHASLSLACLCWAVAGCAGKSPQHKRISTPILSHSSKQVIPHSRTAASAQRHGREISHSHTAVLSPTVPTLRRHRVVRSNFGISHLEFSSNGKYLLSISHRFNTHDIDIPKYLSGEVQVWNGAGMLLRTLSTGTEPLCNAVFLPDKVSLVTVHPRRLKIWSISTGQLRRIIPTQSQLVAFSSDRRLAATAHAHNNVVVTLHIFNPLTGQTRSSSRIVLNQSQLLSSGDLGIGFLPDGRRILSESRGTGAIIEWQVKSGRYVGIHPDPDFDAVIPHSYSPDGHIALSVDYENVGPHFQPRFVTLRDPVTWKPPKQLPFQALASTRPNVPYSDVKDALFSPDGRWITGIVDQELWFWSTKDWNVVKRFTLPFPCNALTFSPNGNTLVAGGGQRLIFWRIK
jgi:WD40 repeat protein